MLLPFHLLLVPAAVCLVSQDAVLDWGSSLESIGAEQVGPVGLEPRIPQTAPFGTSLAPELLVCWRCWTSQVHYDSVMSSGWGPRPDSVLASDEAWLPLASNFSQFA